MLFPLIKFRSGFTVIELLVVIAIFGILSSIVLIAVRGVQDQARLANVVAYAGQVNRALKFYCLASFEFEENTGTSAKDDCKQVTGTLNGTVGWVAGPNKDYAVDLSGGAGSNITATIPALTSSLVTVDALVYNHSVTGLNVFYSTALPLSIARNGDTYSVAFNDASSVPQSLASAAGVAKLNQWQHIVFTHDSSTNNSKLIVDGVEVANLNTTMALSGAATTTYIGSDYNGSNNFDGSISGLHVYNEYLK